MSRFGGGRKKLTDWSGAEWWVFSVDGAAAGDADGARLLLFQSPRTGKWVCLEWPEELAGPDELDAGQLRALLPLAVPMRREVARRLLDGRPADRTRSGRAAS